MTEALLSSILEGIILLVVLPVLGWLLKARLDRIEALARRIHKLESMMTAMAMHTNMPSHLWKDDYDRAAD